MDSQKTIIPATTLQPCSSRASLPGSTEYFCFHLRSKTASGYVDPTICGECTVRGMPSPGRRTIPSTHAGPVSDQAAGTMPGATTQIKSVFNALGKFIADGMHLTSDEEYKSRLAICESCDQFSNDRCVKCGCYVSIKARAQVFQCPLNKWPTIEGDLA